MGQSTSVDAVPRGHMPDTARCNLLASLDGHLEKLREAILDMAIRGALVLEGQPGPGPLAADPDGDPFSLPVGWKWVFAENVFSSIADGDHQAPPKSDDGVPFLVIGNVCKGVLDFAETRFVSPAYFSKLLDSRRPQRGDLLYTVVGSFGIPVVVDSKQPFCVQRHIAILRPSESLDVRYAAHLFRSPFVYGQANTCATGTAQKTVSLGTLRKFRLPLPPLAEQKRIVAKVDQLMALCDDLEAKQTKKRDLATQSTRSALTALTTAETADDLAAAWRRVAKNFGDVLGDAQGILALKDAVLALAVRGQIENAAPGDESIEHVADRLSRARDAWAAKARGNHDAFPEVEDAPFEVARWRWIRLGNLAEIVGGVPKGRKLAGRQVSSFPYLRVANVQRGFLDLTVMKELEIPREELPRYRLLPNDVLFTEGGDWDKLGRSAVWPGKIDPCIHQNHIFRARLLTKDIDPRWVSMFCNSPVGRAYFENAAKQTTNPATINMTELRHCPIPVPPPQEQRRILDRLHQITSLLDDLEARLGKQEETATRLAESLAAAVAG